MEETLDMLLKSGGTTMKVYIQSDKHHVPLDRDFFIAYCGFMEMGAEIIFFYTPEELRESYPEDVVVGYVGTVTQRLHEFGIEIPDLDYPEELSAYLGRNVWHSTINTINTHPELWPVFVKSVKDKRITGRTIRSPKDLIGCGMWNSDQDVWCSNPVDFVTEWRCFVRYGHILDVRHYKGDWRKSLDPNIVEAAVSSYASAPKAYGIDFGLTKDERTLLLEVNDGFSLGNYGLFYLDYAKLLATRWSELTHTSDAFNF